MGELFKANKYLGKYRTTAASPSHSWRMVHHSTVVRSRN